MMWGAILLLIVALAASEKCFEKEMSNYVEYDVIAASDITSMTLLREGYNNAVICKLNESFGFTGTWLWVNDGCRGIFNVCYTPNDDPTTTTTTTVLPPKTTTPITTPPPPTTTTTPTTPSPTTTTAPYRQGPRGIDMTVTKEAFEVGITKDFELECGYGKPDPTIKVGPVSIKLERQPKGTNGWKNIAAIVRTFGPKVNVQDDLGAAVTGTLISNGVCTTSFIKFKWVFPKADVVGAYRCIVRTMDGTGFINTTETSVEVKGEAPTLPALIERVNDIDLDLDTIKAGKTCAKDYCQELKDLEVKQKLLGIYLAQAQLILDGQTNLKPISTLTVTPSDQTDGDNVTLVCSTSPASPSVTTYEFVHNGSSLGDSPSDMISRSTLGTEDGNYSCIAKTDDESFEPSEDVTVAFIPRTPTLLIDPVNGDGTVTSGEANQYIRCQTESDTDTHNSTYVFYKDEVIAQDSEDSSMKLSPLQVSDSGANYTCTVEMNNKVSHSSNSIALNVVGVICPPWGITKKHDPLKNDCSGYVKCVEGVATHHDCPGDTVFDEYTWVCGYLTKCPGSG